jgi:putative oxidoreductase
VVALLFLQHGLTKLFGFPGAAPANFNWITLAPGLASLIETFGSLALLFGFYTRAAAFIMSGEMAVAYFMVHQPRSFFPYNNGGDAAVLYCFVFLYLALVGGGEWSVDAKLAKA